ncbi:MAG: ThuA domain-containing protein [Chloroflexi bacterium]|nr:ThuA domain-containing protein [Chloroflexota bacterium]
MSKQPFRAHLIAGGFPPGAHNGHDHDYARLRLLELLERKEVPASVSGDYQDIDKWLPISRLLITYTAGPILDDRQALFVRDWLRSGGRWLGLHGTSGGRAARVEGSQRRKMVKSAHHEALGAFFINHPPVRRFQVNVADPQSPLAADVPESFEVIDEPYMIEVQDLAQSRVLLTAKLGPDNSNFGFLYDKDTALLPDGQTRVLGYSREVGEGGVTYIAIGHCHSPTTNSQPFVDKSVEPEGKTPARLRATWEAPAFARLLENSVDWGMR